MMSDFEREFGELKATVKGLCAAFVDFRTETRIQLAGIETALAESLNKHSDRLGSLERWRAWVMGGVGLAIFLWGVLLGWLKLRGS